MTWFNKACLNKHIGHCLYTR